MIKPKYIIGVEFQGTTTGYQWEKFKNPAEVMNYILNIMDYIDKHEWTAKFIYGYCGDWEKMEYKAKTQGETK